MKSNLAPVLCMKRDTDTLKWCLDNIAVGEPCAVLEIKGSGVKIIYYDLVDKLKDVYNDRVVYSITVNHQEELQSYLTMLRQEQRSVICLIYLATDSDCSWFIRELDALRESRNINICSVIFSRITDAYESSIQKQKILYRNLRILSPIDITDTKLLINDFGRRFDYLPSEEDIQQIYLLSGGHVGLVKTLYMYLRDTHTTELKLENIIQTPSVISRLEDMFRGLPDDIKLALSFYPYPSQHDQFLEQFHFIEDNKIFSPVLEKYLKQSQPFPIAEDNIQLDTELSVNEKKAFEYLKNHKGEIVEREDLGIIIWGSDFDEKYSDWALDQIIHRIREKLEKTKEKYTILTKKGRGFILQDLR